MSKKGRRELARALGRGPLRPSQIGVGVFSAAFLLVGFAVFLATASPLVQGELSKGALPLDGFLSGVSSDSSQGGADGEAGRAAGEREGSSGGDADASGDPSQAAADGGVAESAGGQGGSVSFPSVTAPDAGSASGQGSQTEGGESGASNSAGSSDSSGGASSGGGSSSSAASGPSEAQEQATLQFLRAKYDELAGHQQRIAEDYAQFPSLGLTPSGDQRYVYFSEAVYSRDQVDIAAIEMEEFQLPAGSRYASAFQNIKQLYSDLSNAAAILARAWYINCEFDDPSAYVDAWMSPIYENSSGGKLTFFADYESRYPGARP